MTEGTCENLFQKKSKQNAILHTKRKPLTVATNYKHMQRASWGTVRPSLPCCILLFQAGESSIVEAEGVQSEASNRVQCGASFDGVQFSFDLVS